MAKTRRKPGRKTRSAAQRRATAKLVAWNKAKRKGYSGNPIAKRARRMARRTTAAVASYRRRRRNPISLGGSGVMSTIKTALLGGVGAVGVDLAYGQVAKFLPASLQRRPNQLGLGDAVKAAFTVALGVLLKKPTRGMSTKMAEGSLIVQTYQAATRLIPSSLPLGYTSPVPVAAGNSRFTPQGLRAYTGAGRTPLLSAYTPGASVLSGASSGTNARMREASPR